MQFGLIDAVWHWGTYRPTKAALVSNGHALTYGELLVRAEHVARVVRNSGFNGRIAVSAQHKAAFVAMLLGVMRAGNSAVILNPRLADGVLGQTISDTSPDLLIQDRDLANSWSPDALTSVRRLTFDSFEDNVSMDVSWPKPTPTSEWGVLFSSGSTGVPKGVERDHDSMITEIIGWCLELPLTKHSVFYVGRPLFYTGGLVLALASFFVGATVIANDYGNEDAPTEVWSDYQKALSTYNIEWAFFVPDQLRAFVAAHPTQPAHSKFILVMGAPISGAEKREARTVLGSQIVESWGNSEALGTITEPEDLDLRPDSVGRPFLTDFLTVVDQSLKPCKPGEVGRIAGSETAGFHEYSNRPDETRQVKAQALIISDDIGYTDADGYFYVHGRDQDHVVRGGSSLFLPEVAEKIRTHADIAEVEVCAIGGENDMQLCAAVVLAPTATATADDCCAIVNALLCRKERLSRVLVLDRLPTLASGKIDRVGVRRLLEHPK